jgi:hypothetical protein
VDGDNYIPLHKKLITGQPGKFDTSRTIIPGGILRERLDQIEATEKSYLNDL